METGQEMEMAQLGRRGARRTRVFDAGILADSVDMTSLDCLIRNVSRTGAQVRINAGHIIAYDSFLIDLKNRAAFRAHPVWRQGSLLGVHFEESYLLNYDLPSHLGFLKNIFVEARLRQQDNIAIMTSHPGTAQTWRLALNL